MLKDYWRTIPMDKRYIILSLTIRTLYFVCRWTFIYYCLIYHADLADTIYILNNGPWKTVVLADPILVDVLAYGLALMLIFFTLIRPLRFFFQISFLNRLYYGLFFAGIYIRSYYMELLSHFSY